MLRLLIASMLVLGSAAVSSVASADPPESHEILTDRPSGFWTSNRPAVGGAYKYPLLLVGVLVCGITAFFVVRTLKRASADRAAGRGPRFR